MFFFFPKDIFIVGSNCSKFYPVSCFPSLWRDRVRQLGRHFREETAMEPKGMKMGSRFLVCASPLAEVTKGKLPFIQRVAYSTFRIDAYDHEVAFVSAKEP